MATPLQSRMAQETSTARTTTALRVIVGLSLAAACIMALAQASDSAPAFGRDEPNLEALERSFWACDHAASTFGVSAGEGMACSDATEQLKLQKFNGDFGAMLAWWKQNKRAAYQALDGSEPVAAADDDFPQP